jgi:hypothetical protein
MTERDEVLWRQLVENRLSAFQLYEEFFAEGCDRVGILRTTKNGNEDAMKFTLIPFLAMPERLEFFDYLVMQASTIKYGSAARYVIAACLPRDWVLANIERVSQPFLADDADYIDYQMMLELYCALDRGLAMQLAQKAIAHSDSEVRDVAEDFVKRLLAAHGVPRKPPEGPAAL